VPVSLEAALGVGALLGGLQQQQAALAEHQYTALEHIQQASEMAWRHRLFDSLLVFQNNQMDPDVARIGAHVRSTLIAVPEATNVPLTLSITPTTGWRLRFMAARGSGLGDDDLRLWVEDLMAAWAGLDALGAQDESGASVHVADWFARMPTASARRVQALHAPHRESADLAAASGTGRSEPQPTSALEAALAAIWCELLGMENVPLTTNYFDMGVHSLLLVRAHRLINERLGLNLPLLALLQHANIRALAQHLARAAPEPQSVLAQSALDRVRKLRDAQRKHAERLARSSDV